VTQQQFEQQPIATVAPADDEARVTQIPQRHALARRPLVLAMHRMPGRYIKAAH
jgi:hypothetical protein